jgi:hypothetical protein
LVTGGSMGAHKAGYELNSLVSADGTSSLTHKGNVSARGVTAEGESSATTDAGGRTSHKHSVHGSAQGHTAKLQGDDENGMEFLLDPETAPATE